MGLTWGGGLGNDIALTISERREREREKEGGKIIQRMTID